MVCGRQERCKVGGGGERMYVAGQGFIKRLVKLGNTCSHVVFMAGHLITVPVHWNFCIHSLDLRHLKRARAKTSTVSCGRGKC